MFTCLCSPLEDDIYFTPNKYPLFSNGYTFSGGYQKQCLKSFGKKYIRDIIAILSWKKLCFKTKFRIISSEQWIFDEVDPTPLSLNVLKQKKWKGKRYIFTVSFDKTFFLLKPWQGCVHVCNLSVAVLPRLSGYRIGLHLCLFSNYLSSATVAYTYVHTSQTHVKIRILNAGVVWYGWTLEDDIYVPAFTRFKQPSCIIVKDVSKITISKRLFLGHF